MKFLGMRKVKEDKVDWLEVEMGEHEYLRSLLENLELELDGGMDDGNDVVMSENATEYVDEFLEHTILDKMMLGT